MANYTAKSKFKALRNLGTEVLQGQIGSYLRDASWADEFVVDFAGKPWYFHKDTLDTIELSDEPAIEYIGEAE